jgi:ABC-type lipoprotein release transport system permease subunit
MFGRDAPVPRDRVEELARLDGVLRAVPRIIGRLRLGREYVVVVGVPLGQLAGQPLPLEGALPARAEEVLVGREVARGRGLRPGSTLVLEGDTIRLFKVSGVTAATSSLWSARTVVIDLEEAAIVFGEAGHVSDVCLYTRAGYETLVAEAAGRLDRRYRIQTQDLVRAYVARGMTLREGIFTVLFALALALAIPSFAVMSYLGQVPRRREIGLLKAEGWRTADVLEMVALENVIVSLLAAGGAGLLALLWVKALGAPLIAPFLIAELPLFPQMEIPSRFLPIPALLALAFSLAVTMTGSIYSTWRTAAVRPAEVLR